MRQPAAWGFRLLLLLQASDEGPNHPGVGKMLKFRGNLVGQGVDMAFFVMPSGEALTTAQVKVMTTAVKGRYSYSYSLTG
jgi:hypothetical protein